MGGQQPCKRDDAIGRLIKRLAFRPTHFDVRTNIDGSLVISKAVESHILPPEAHVVGVAWVSRNVAAAATQINEKDDVKCQIEDRSHTRKRVEIFHAVKS